ncbi:MAG: hypothetical protein ACLSUW_10700 [Akkermansia sp.]
MGAGDFRPPVSDLWRNGFGMPYEQRNSLVVGFIMGFAVILSSSPFPRMP